MNCSEATITKAPLIIDKFSQTYGADATTINRGNVSQSLLALRSSDGYQVKKLKKPKRYTHGISIYPKGNKQRKLCIWWKPKEKIRTQDGKEIRFARIECSPQHHDDLSIGATLKWLFEHADCVDVDLLFRNPYVTRIDLALDVYGIKPEDFLISFDNVYTGKAHFTDSYDINAWALSTRASRKSALAYDKELELLMKGKIAELPNYTRTRLEVRLKPECRLDALGSIKNPFLQVRLYYPDLMKDDRLPNWFRAMLIFHPVGAVLTLVEERNQRERIRRVLKQYVMQLFDPGEIWHAYPTELLKLAAFNR